MPINLKYMILVPLVAGASIAGITLPIVYSKSKRETINALKEEEQWEELEEIKFSELQDNIFSREKIETAFKNVDSGSDIKVPDEALTEKFKAAVKVVQELSSKGDLESSQSGERRRLTAENKEALMQMYMFYSNLSGKSKRGSGPENRTTSKSPGVLSSLDTIDWIKDNIKILANGNENNGWGWGNWSVNPFRKFFRDEAEWKASMKKDIEKKSSQQEGKYISEVELKIATRLIKKIVALHKEFSQTKN